MDQLINASINKSLALTHPIWKIRLGPSGIHFFNRISGLNILFDDIKVKPELWAKAPRQVSIALTNLCDLSCKFCFVPKNENMLNFRKLLSWLKELDLNGTIGVGFGGGEPTLYPKLKELCSYASKNTRLALTLTTHAHNLNSNLANELKGKLHFIRVSMDGVGSTYEKIRGRSFATFRHCLDIVKSISPFGINYVVNSQTFPDLDAAVKLATDTGAVEILLLPEHSMGGKCGIDKLTIEKLHQWVIKYQGNIPLAISQTNADGFPICDPYLDENDLNQYAHIDTLGNLKRSSFDDIGVAIRNDGIICAIKKLQNQ